MNTIIVTGGAGFIGSHLIDKLLTMNYRVICIDNFDRFYAKANKLANIQQAKQNKNFFFYYADIRNTNLLNRIMKKHSPFYSVIHLAARAGVRPSIIKPKIYESINIGGTYNLLQIISRYKIRQHIYASSSSVYGDNTVPFSENDLSIKPLSPYGATKLAGEQISFVYHKLYQIPTTILRFFSVYGPRGRPDMAPFLFTKTIFANQKIKQFGDGSSARDWTYIDDIVDGITRVVKKPLGFEVVNLGGSKPIRLSTLLNTIESLTGKRFKKMILARRLEEPEITCADIKKAKKMLRWKPQIEFKQGMIKFLNWYTKGLNAS